MRYVSVVLSGALFTVMWGMLFAISEIVTGLIRCVGDRFDDNSCAICFTNATQSPLLTCCQTPFIFLSMPENSELKILWLLLF